MDEDGNLIEVNKAWCDLSGYSEAGAIGRSLEEFLAPVHQEYFRDCFAQFKAAGETHDAESEMVRKDGSHIIVSFDGTIGYDEQGNFKQPHCTMQDITERKRAEETLQESEERFRDLYENAPNAYFSVGVDSCIRRCNRRAGELLGHAADTPGGIFPGNPVGRNPNGDTVVDEGDIYYILPLVFGDSAADGGGGDPNSVTGLPLRFRPASPSDGRTLAIPDQVPASPGNKVRLRVHFTANGNDFSSVAFSVDYDQTWLTFDPTDSNGDDVPDAITFNLPSAFDASCSFDANNTDGELDCLIADPLPPLASLSYGAIVSVTLNVGSPPIRAELAVNFSQDPAASFGDTSGQSVPGTMDAGSVLIVPTDTYQVHLPLLRKSSQ